MKELFEVLNCYCNRNSGAVSKEDKRKYSFMLKRLVSAQFPIQCELVNRLEGIGYSTATEIVARNTVPDFMNSDNFDDDDEMIQYPGSEK